MGEKNLRPLQHVLEMVFAPNTRTNRAFVYMAVEDDCSSKTASLLESLVGYFRGKLASQGIERGGVFADWVDRAETLIERPEGQKLNRALDRGDHVILDGPTDFKDLHDLGTTLAIWCARNPRPFPG